jgi:hypothetical protein
LINKAVYFKHVISTASAESNMTDKSGTEEQKTPGLATAADASGHGAARDLLHAIPRRCSSRLRHIDIGTGGWHLLNI